MVYQKTGVGYRDGSNGFWVRSVGNVQVISTAFSSTIGWKLEYNVLHCGHVDDRVDSCSGIVSATSQTR